MPAGGPQKPDYKVRTPGDGARTDLSGQSQPVRVPTGLPYGGAQRLKNIEQSASIPTTTPMSPQGAPGAPAGAVGPPPAPWDPMEVLHATSGHYTNEPENPMVPSEDPAQTLAVKVDALHWLTQQPFAGPETFALARQAEEELSAHIAQRYVGPPNTPTGPTSTPPPGLTDPPPFESV